MWLLRDRAKVSPASLVRASCASQNTTVNISIATGSCALDLHDRIGIFAGITASAAALSFVRIFLIFWILINGGRVLHNRMFSSIMRVPVRFFDTNPSGKIPLPLCHTLKSVSLIRTNSQPIFKGYRISG